MTIRLYMGDWMMNMGLVGIDRMLNKAIEDDVICPDNQSLFQKVHDGLILETDILNEIPKAYFHYMKETYSVAKRDQRRIDGALKYASTEEKFKTILPDVKKTITETLKKVEKYFLEYADQISEIKNALKNVKNKEQEEILKTCINQFLQIVGIEEINKKLSMNYFKNVIMKPFFGQVSILNVAKNALTFEENIDDFYKDYIVPVLKELSFLEIIQEATSSQEIMTFIDNNIDYQPFKALKRAFKKLNVDEIKDYVNGEIMECSLIEGQLAFTNYEEMVFSPLGISCSKALNFSWDYYDQHPVPLSSLAKLVLFCAPIGATFYYRKDGFGNQGESRLYAGFVQVEGAFEDILQVNNNFLLQKSRSMSFESALSYMIQDLQKEATYTRDYFFLELSSDYDSKKTLLDYYHIPQYLINYLSSYVEKWKYIRPTEYREHLIRQVLRGIDPKYVIFIYAKSILQKKMNGFGLYIATRERNRILHMKKGVTDVKEIDKKVYAVYKSGQTIRKHFESIGEQRGQLEVYTADASKKITGIAYRLLNAAKAGDKKSFMDTMMRLHLSTNEPVPPIFLNALHEKDIDFATVANGFIAGLLSKDIEKKGEEQSE